MKNQVLLGGSVINYVGKGVNQKTIVFDRLSLILQVECCEDRVDTWVTKEDVL